MLAPVPELADYGISPDHGFLPSELPLTTLPDPYYARWEAIASNLQGLLLSKRIRETVDRLPTLSTSYLQSESEWRRAYVVLVFILHAYVWGGHKPQEVSAYCTCNDAMMQWLTQCFSENPSPTDHTPVGNLRPPGTSPRSHLCRRVSLELQTSLPR